jgi:hypothetical protein
MIQPAVICHLCTFVVGSAAARPIVHYLSLPCWPSPLLPPLRLATARCLFITLQCTAPPPIHLLSPCLSISYPSPYHPPSSTPKPFDNAQNAHFLTQIPHPIHSSSEMNAFLSVGLTSIHSLPILTTGHPRLHSWRHFLGLHCARQLSSIISTVCSRRMGMWEQDAPCRPRRWPHA